MEVPAVLGTLSLHRWAWDLSFCHSQGPRSVSWRSAFDGPFGPPGIPLIIQPPFPFPAPSIFGPNERNMTMEFFQWHWWAGLAILLMIAEIFVPGFFLLCLGIGAAGASVADAVGLGAPGQLIAFSAFSLIAFFTIRPLLMKRMWNTPEIRTNVEALVGQRGKVTQDFDPGLRLGRVAAAGDDWRAESVNDRALRVGDLIEVVRVESNTLIVKPVEMA